MDVRAAQCPYLPSSGDLALHQETCTHIRMMRHQHQQQLGLARLEAVRQAISGDHIWQVATVPVELS